MVAKMCKISIVLRVQVITTNYIIMGPIFRLLPRQVYQNQEQIVRSKIKHGMHKFPFLKRKAITRIPDFI